MAQAYLGLRRQNVAPISPASQRLRGWHPNAAGIRGFYFKDPGGHACELLQFPPGTGDVRWRWITVVFTPALARSLSG